MLPDERSVMVGAIRHLHTIGRQARPAGSPQEDDVRAWCRTHLEQHGFSVREEPFEYSAAIGRWMVPVMAAIAASALGLTALAWRAGTTPGETALPLVMLTATLVIASVWGARLGVLDCPLARRTGINLVATRGAPGLWFVAHLDTKSQPIPTLVRAALLVALGVSLVASLAVPVIWPAGSGAPWALPLVGAALGLPLSLATVGSDSPGARDNATGVAAVLEAIDHAAPGQSLGVLMTSAEELGLAGARAWVRRRPPGVAINVDTVDDTGTIVCMVHGRQSGSLGTSLREAGRRALGESIRVSGLVPGLLTDGVALGDAGWEVVTISRGTWRTLARIHRPSDTVVGLTGQGADAISRLLAAFLSERT